ncbi:hypothetical protein FH972_012567 [Carpinus fangiana]|uniref:Uncharacterized protein n=1 Tax=Carpinus fangiana TaxID=176857 RepID=A0A5N6R6I3_9ROSI|nr:hypothetical protein FH972_012567 [Carpinus fangiana]
MATMQLNVEVSGNDSLARKGPKGVCNSTKMQFGVAFNGDGSLARRGPREVRRRCVVDGLGDLVCKLSRWVRVGEKYVLIRLE